MILGIDASNIRADGGITHLVELLKYAAPQKFGFEKVIVWSSRLTLGKLQDRHWLVKCDDESLEGNFVATALWQQFCLGSRAMSEKCNILFVPGGSFGTRFRPIVTMSQNLLPFDWRELLRYGVSKSALKLILLRWSQSRSFKAAEGVIFLTDYARRTVLQATGPIRGDVREIPHGIDERFFKVPRIPRPIEGCTESDPFVVLYVSKFEKYKNHIEVLKAVSELRQGGLPIALTLVGATNGPGYEDFCDAAERLDPARKFVRLLGHVSYDALDRSYVNADVCVFASTCENMPNILLEGMASGLPLACSNRGPMPEVLGDAGIYFDPQEPSSIAAAIRQLIDDPRLRESKATLAYSRARKYSWKRCADETFRFLSDCASR